MECWPDNPADGAYDRGHGAAADRHADEAPAAAAATADGGEKGRR